mmetsp:Transcript_1192/g.2828  ORF Transcript_1192/g.2828 Transcript_1192/m.2828 type:complete len:347 (+) Transcript_1192:832-1872(+)
MRRIMSKRALKDFGPFEPSHEAVCQVPGCTGALNTVYNIRYRICSDHMVSPEVQVHGEMQRFCQKCLEFHPVAFFDGRKFKCNPRRREAVAKYRESNISRVTRSVNGLETPVSTYLEQIMNVSSTGTAAGGTHQNCDEVAHSGKSREQPQEIGSRTPRMFAMDEKCSDGQNLQLGDQAAACPVPSSMVFMQSQTSRPNDLEPPPRGGFMRIRGAFGLLPGGDSAYSCNSSGASFRDFWRNMVLKSGQEHMGFDEWILHHRRLRLSHYHNGCAPGYQFRTSWEGSPYSAMQTALNSFWKQYHEGRDGTNFQNSHHRSRSQGVHDEHHPITSTAVEAAFRSTAHGLPP